MVQAGRRSASAVGLDAYTFSLARACILLYQSRLFNVVAINVALVIVALALMPPRFNWVAMIRFGTVYKASLKGEHAVAVKTMRVAKISKGELAKFKSELIIMAPLHHPNLVRLFGGVWNEGADKLCIVLEFCAKGSLKSFLKKEAGTWIGLRRGLAIGSAKGLAYLHHDLKKALIHRDVKPDNILVSDNLVAKVADFGESKRFDHESARRNSSAHDDVATMTMVGTMLYCAPEVILGERYNESVASFFSSKCISAHVAA